MPSLTRTIGEALSVYLVGLTKPTIAGITYDSDTNFKVVNSRPNLNRDALGSDLKTWIQLQNRVLNGNLITDRCGVKTSSEMLIVTARKLNSWDPDTSQPGSVEEMDGCLEFAEWVQGQVLVSRSVGDFKLFEFTSNAMNDQVYLDDGICYSELAVTYG